MHSDAPRNGATLNGAVASGAGRCTARAITTLGVSERRRLRLRHRVILGAEPSVRGGTFQRRAVFRQRRPEGDRLARPAVPDRVPAAAVTEAGDMADKHLVGAERVTVGASRGRVSEPLPAALDQVTGCHQMSLRQNLDNRGPRTTKPPAPALAGRSRRQRRDSRATTQRAGRAGPSGPRPTAR
jgi:hypothetical protein